MGRIDRLRAAKLYRYCSVKAKRTKTSDRPGLLLLIGTCQRELDDLEDNELALLVFVEGEQVDGGTRGL